MKFKALATALATAAFAMTAFSPVSANDRTTHFYGLNPPSAWHNQEERFNRLALGEFWHALFLATGSPNGVYSDLIVSPSSGLYVQVAPTLTNGIGALYQLEQDDTSAYGVPPAGLSATSTALSADPTLIVGQGLLSSPPDVVGPLTAPSSGSTAYTVECQNRIVDRTPQNVNAVSASGSTTQVTANRDRAETIFCQSTAGNTGNPPSTPAADSGYVALATVVVPSGATSLSQSEVTMSSASSFSGFVPASANGSLAVSSLPHGDYYNESGGTLNGSMLATGNVVATNNIQGMTGNFGGSPNAAMGSIFLSSAQGGNGTFAANGFDPTRPADYNGSGASYAISINRSGGSLETDFFDENAEGPSVGRSAFNFYYEDSSTATNNNASTEHMLMTLDGAANLTILGSGSVSAPNFTSSGSYTAGSSYFNSSSASFNGTLVASSVTSNGNLTFANGAYFFANNGSLGFSTGNNQTTGMYFSNAANSVANTTFADGGGVTLNRGNLVVSNGSGSFTGPVSTSAVVAGGATFEGTSSQTLLIPAASGAPIQFANAANSVVNTIFADAGGMTLARGGISVAAGNISASGSLGFAGGALLTNNGNSVYLATGAGNTGGFYFANAANNAVNLTISDGGNVSVVRGTLSVAGALSSGGAVSGTSFSTGGAVSAASLTTTGNISGNNISGTGGFFTALLDSGLTSGSCVQVSGTTLVSAPGACETAVGGDTKSVSVVSTTSGFSCAGSTDCGTTASGNWGYTFSVTPKCQATMQYGSLAPVTVRCNPSTTGYTLEFYNAQSTSVSGNLIVDVTAFGS